jgi:hypothetical protein
VEYDSLFVLARDEWKTMSPETVEFPDSFDLPGGKDSSNRIWRVLALVGVAAALLTALVQSFPFEPRQARHFLFAGLIIGATLIVLRTLFRAAWENAMSTPDWLVPIGVMMLASTTVEFMGMSPLLKAEFTPSWFKSLGSWFSLSLSMVLHMIVMTAYAAWQTDLLWRTAQGGATPELAPWIPIRRHFLRTFVVLAIGLGVLLVSMLPAMALLGSKTILVGLLAMGLIGIVWNLVTVALLPVVILSPSSLLVAIREGFHHSWHLKGQWWKQLMAHLVLLGLLVFLRVHFTTTVQTTDVVKSVAQVPLQTIVRTNVHVNAFWVGGYENKCRWYSKYALAIDTKQVPMITKMLSLLFLVVAVAMKWTVIHRLVSKVKFPGHKSDSNTSTLHEPFR